MGISCRNPLSKLAEGNENEDEDDEDNNEVNQEDTGTSTSPVHKWTPSGSKLSVSLKGPCFSGSSKCHSGIPMNRASTKSDHGYSGYHSEHQSGGWSANDAPSQLKLCEAVRL
uniref:Uncharacterized protein n=1 Tax=Arundo donax TaxID=35708 RepID=A0A0A9EED5_ARUDO